MLRKLWDRFSGQAPTPDDAERFTGMLTRMEQSELGRELAQHVRTLQERHQVEFKFTTRADIQRDPDWQQRDGLIRTTGRTGQVGDAELGLEPNHSTVMLHHRLKAPGQEEQQFLAFVHETGHLEQQWQRPIPYGKTAEEQVSRGFAEEAHAAAQVCRVAYELDRAGDPQAWTAFRNDARTADIARAFEAAVPEGIDQAVQAARDQWGVSPQRRDEYRQQFLAEAPQAKEGVQERQASRAAYLEEEHRTSFDERQRTLDLPRTQEQEQSARPAPTPQHWHSRQ
jgi:hypothetical protein